MLFTIAGLALMFVFVASLGAILTRQKRQLRAGMETLSDELGSEPLPGDSGTYVSDGDLQSEMCVFCGDADDACYECGTVGR